LRKKVKFLERENNRLRKELNRLYQERDAELGPDREEDERRKKQGFQVKQSHVVSCDKCHSTNLTHLQLGTPSKAKDVFICNDCGKRKSVER
jgi:superfamily II helicase